MIIIIFVRYGCETWSLTIKEECRLRIFENRILRRIFGPKRDENGKGRRLHNEELHSLYRTPNIVRMIKSRKLRWAGHIARMEEFFSYVYTTRQRFKSIIHYFIIKNRIISK